MTKNIDKPRNQDGNVQSFMFGSPQTEVHGAKAKKDTSNTMSDLSEFLASSLAEIWAALDQISTKINHFQTQIDDLYQKIENINIQNTTIVNATELRIAYCKTDAGAGTTLVCYLDEDATGAEVTVNFLNCRTSDLDEAFPRLQDGDAVTVFQVGDSWYSTQTVGGEAPHYAFCKNDASTGTTITCYLDTDATGEEITVYCSMCRASNLNAAVPRLQDGDRISVIKIDGYWRSLQTFIGTEDCE
jgi:hypothetical protein